MNVNCGINNEISRNMKRIIAILFPICFVISAYGQITDNLVALGFEDVRVLDVDNTTYVSWEDNRYRSSYTGVSVALRSILEVADTCHNVEFIVTKGGLPQLHLATSSHDVSGYRNSRISFDELVEQMDIDFDTDATWKVLASEPKKNASSWKADFVVYPQLGLDNSTLDDLYLYYINLAPAFEMELWKGAKFTLQGIFPIVTNVEGTHKMVRPGYITLSQDFDLKKGFKLQAVAGNFSANRAGALLRAKWYSKNGRFEVGGNVAGTVQSIVTPGNGWTFSKNMRMSGALYAQYYVPKFNTELKLQYDRYVYGHNGVRADLKRHFGEYTIGVYALYVKCDDADNNFNAGFNFSIPLPGKKYMQHRKARIRPARDWNLEYSIKAIWNRDGLEDLTKHVVPSLNDGDAGLFLQPDYIRHFIIREYEKGKQQ